MAGSSRFSDDYLAEAEARIREMEDPSYEFPEAFSKTDWILAIGTILVTGVLLIAGYWM